MANKHMKRCPNHRSPGNTIQNHKEKPQHIIRVAVSYHTHTHTHRMASVGENVGRLEPCVLSVGCKMCRSCGNHYGGASKNTELPYDPVIPLLGIESSEMKAGTQIFAHLCSQQHDRQQPSASPHPQTPFVNKPHILQAQSLDPDRCIWGLVSCSLPATARAVRQRAAASPLGTDHGSHFIVGVLSLPGLEPRKVSWLQG